MENQRQKTREALCYYLKVIDLETGKEIGRIGDITSDGMMIFGNTAFETGSVRNIRVILANSVFDAQMGNLDTKVEVRWTKPDANPSLILTGMLFLGLDKNGEKIVANLIEKIGINHDLTSD